MPAVKYFTEEERIEARKARQRIYDKKRSILHRDRILERNRVYREKNRQKFNDMSKEWKGSNPDLYKQLQHEYYLKRKKTIRHMNVGRVDITLVGNYHSRLCGICHELIIGEFHIDHIIPVSRGGRHEYKNLQLAHPSCNVRKHNKLPSEMLIV